MDVQHEDSRSRPVLRTELRGVARIGAIFSVVMFLGAVAASAVIQISGAVIAPGTVAVAGKPKSVQHLDGGIVEEILVSDGDAVEAGDVLLRLDSTVLEANLDIYKTRLTDALALRARLEAERSGSKDMTFSSGSSLLSDVPQETSREGQREIFRTRQEVQKGRRQQLAEKVEQYNNQVAGTKAQIAAKRKQLKLIARELEAMSKLREKGLVRESVVLSLQRNQADLLGQIGEHESELARIANSIRDTELEILLLEEQFREEAVVELREITTSIEELTQQIVSTQKQLDRVRIRAPVSGLVHEMQVVTVGGVVPPGAVIMQIIPHEKGNQFETRVNPASIDQVFIGQEARIRLLAANHRTTPTLTGQVTGISPDAVTDEASGLSYYRVLLTISPEEKARLGDMALVPGMPIEAFVQTGDRSILSYLLRPLSDRLNKAFREE